MRLVCKYRYVTKNTIKAIKIIFANNSGSTVPAAPSLCIVFFLQAKTSLVRFAADFWQKLKTCFCDLV